MKTPLTALVLTLAVAAPLAAQSERQNFEAAEKLKPAHLTSASRIAPASEPGAPFLLHGVILDPAGKPAAGVEVFAYHTDQGGIYAQPGAAEPWRLKGWAVTDAQGRFEFRTIRPGPYPGGQIPAHVHFIFSTGCCGRQNGEVMFEDDPIATPEFRQKNQQMLYGKVTRGADGVQEVAYTFRLTPRGQ